VTVQAIRHLLARAVFLRQQTLALLVHWIDWRIRHDQNARDAHYRLRINMQL